MASTRSRIRWVRPAEVFGLPQPVFISFGMAVSRRCFKAGAPHGTRSTGDDHKICQIETTEGEGMNRKSRKRMSEDSYLTARASAKLCYFRIY